MEYRPSNSMHTSGESALHILLAEDNLLLQEAMRIVLTKKGFRVSVARTGRQAIERMQQHSIDAVLMAINMPDTNGIDATIAIRRFNTHTPIIAFTSYDETSLIQQLKQIGMNGFLSKYASPEHIYDKIVQLVAERRTA